MAIRIVQLGSPRLQGEGTRIGTVRRPPRGVRKQDHARQDWYDVWFPDLSPSADLMARGKAAVSDADWRVFERAFRAEMKDPAAARALDLLAAISQTADISVGCYCEDEARCHRSVLRTLLVERGARIG